MHSQANQATRHVVGVDVGTGSVRAGVFDAQGTLLAAHSHPITLHKGEGDRVEQSSDEIWAAVVISVRAALQTAGVSANSVVGLGFDATCSLVVLDGQGRPLPVGDSGDNSRNVIVWMDHRALAQAERINATQHPVLDYVGGRISPEMQTPKLLWLKEHAPEVFQRAEHFFDLTDFLTWRATGSVQRSSCTLTCKWTYLAHERRWDDSYFECVGLAELSQDGHRRIGQDVVAPGTALNGGLSAQAAEALGLNPGMAVAAGLIDAHAGGVGTVGAPGQGGAQANLAYVFGTSSCTMTSTARAAFVPGVWGPYFDAMVPGLWLNEGGQSVAGAAIDQLIRLHPARAQAQQSADQAECALPNWLSAEARRLAGDGDVADLARGLHVVPEFLGNRAPHAEPNTRALIAGLGMHDDVTQLVGLYVAGVLGLGYGLRQIVRAQAQAGVVVQHIVISGGAGRSDTVRQLLADATGLPVLVPRSDEPVLLGSAVLAAVAAGLYPDLNAAMAAMTAVTRRFDPQSTMRDRHAQRFALFERWQALAIEAAQVAA